MNTLSAFWSQGLPPETRWVEGSNFVDVTFKLDPRTKRVVMMGAIDNMVKCAADRPCRTYEPVVRTAGECLDSNRFPVFP